MKSTICATFLVIFAKIIISSAQVDLICAQGKFCLGLPIQSGCLNQEFSTCEHFASFGLNSTTSQYDFELYSHLATEYTAVGFSTDSRMGDDAVVSCLAPQPSRIMVKMSRNEGNENKPASTDDQQAIKPGNLNIQNGNLRCAFSLPANFKVDTISVDLAQKNYILLAGGKLSGDDITYHNRDKVSKSMIERSGRNIPGQIERSGRNIPAQGNSGTLSKVYSPSDGCGQTKSCFGIPDKEGCNGNAFDECEHVLSYSYNPSTDKVEFVLHVLHEPGEYTAVGLSTDVHMGDDAVVSCQSNSANEIFVKMSRNDGRTNELVSPDGLTIVEKGLKDGKLICVFNLATKFSAGSTSIDMAKNQYHIMIAGGQVSGDDISYHASEQAVVSFPVNLVGRPQILSPGSGSENKKLYKLLHTIGMCLSFLFFMPTGMFISRFYKETWANVRIQVKCFNRRLWFTLHVVCMLLALVLALLAYVIIAVTYSSDSAWYFPTAETEIAYIHNAVGFSALVLLLMQCTTHWLHVMDSKLARLGELFHWAAGLTIYALGVLNIGFAKSWVHNGLDCKGYGGSCDCNRGLLVFIWVIVHTFLYGFMASYICYTDWHLGIGGCRAFCKYPLPLVSQEEAPRPRFRKFLLILFASLSLIMTFMIMLTTPCI